MLVSAGWGFAAGVVDPSDGTKNSLRGVGAIRPGLAPSPTSAAFAARRCALDRTVGRRV